MKPKVRPEDEEKRGERTHIWSASTDNAAGANEPHKYPAFKKRVRARARLKSRIKPVSSGGTLPLMHAAASMSRRNIVCRSIPKLLRQPDQPQARNGAGEPQFGWRMVSPGRYCGCEWSRVFKWDGSVKMTRRETSEWDRSLALARRPNPIAFRFSKRNLLWHLASPLLWFIFRPDFWLKFTWRTVPTVDSIDLHIFRVYSLSIANPIDVDELLCTMGKSRLVHSSNHYIWYYITLYVIFKIYMLYLL